MATTTTTFVQTPDSPDSMSRDLGSILSGLEKCCLVWMAQRMPKWVNSDHLTALGLLGMLGAGASFWAAGDQPRALFGVVIFLFLNWFGDSLDGTLARVRNAQRPKYGYYVDHIADVFGAFFLIGGLGLSSFMGLPIAAALMVVYLMVASEIYLAAYAVGTFRIHFMKLGPTELRILFAMGTLYLLHNPYVTVMGTQYLLFDFGGVCAIVGLLVALLVTVARNTHTLYLREPLR